MLAGYEELFELFFGSSLVACVVLCVLERRLKLAREALENYGAVEQAAQSAFDTLNNGVTDLVLRIVGAPPVAATISATRSFLSGLQRQSPPNLDAVFDGLANYEEQLCDVLSAVEERTENLEDLRAPLALIKENKLDYRNLQNLNKELQSMKMNALRQSRIV